MSKIALTPNDSGTGTFTIASPDSDTNRTLTLPDSAGELLTTTGDGSGLTGIVIPPVFKPLAVSGAAQALDVGDYNFFDAGTLTANTTVSFSSVPTNAKWQYSFISAVISDQWDVSKATFSQRFSVAAQETAPNGIFFKPDGLKMYVIGSTGLDINEYDLSTAWDVSTATFLQLFSVSTQENTPQGIFFKPNGLKMYVIGSSGDEVNEYDLGTAWDVTTATYLQLFSVAGQDTGPTEIFFKPDGTKMYVTGFTGTDINEYDLSTAWDITSASYLQRFSVAGQDTGPRSISFKPDGLKMYILGDTGNDVTEYDLSTAWDITSATSLQVFSVAGQDSTPRGIFFKPDGAKMYVVGLISVGVNEYNLGTLATMSLPASVVGSPYYSLRRDTRVTYDFFTMDGGTTVHLIGEEII